jgi:ribosomal protein S18 acetylase RimI-like enzyme
MPTVRRARPADAPTIAEFNQLLARESEGKSLDPAVLSVGVAAVLADPARGLYFLAEDGGEVIGQTMITTEWSDWRNGWIWWIQSVYVRPEFRRKGVYKQLYRHVQELAARDPAACGFRLYVERENRRAQSAYRALGMIETRYCVFEELKPGIRFYR